MFGKQVILAHALFAVAMAANDWSVPCTAGSCSFDSGDGITSPWASITVDGSTSTLSDITIAAGWTVTNCKPTWASGVANVVIACEGTEAQRSQCSQLFEGGSAENTVVRLPADCGIGPFARVVSIASLPNTRNGGEQYAVAIDYEFSKAEGSDKSLSFSIGVSNVKDGAEPARFNLKQQRRYPLPLAPRFEKSKNIDVPPVSLKKSFNLFETSINCPAAAGGVGFKAGVSVDADVELDAQMAFGVSVKGRVFPLPKIESMKLTGSLTGAATALFDVTANVEGTFTTGSIRLFQVGLPGLNFPGIFNLGPQLVVNTKVEAALGLQAVVQVGATYNFPKVDLVFPPGEGKSVADATPVPNALKLSLAPGVTAEASVTAHLTPRVELGIEVLGGIAKADIFLEVDGTATLGATAEASAEFTPNVAASLSGCATLDAGFAIVAGAEGSIPGIFDKDINFDLFRKDFSLFKKCFGKSANRKAFASGRRQRFRRPSMTKRELTCPSGVLAKRDVTLW